MDKIWQPSEGHLIEPKCVAHNVKACFQCAVMTPLQQRLEAETTEIFVWECINCGHRIMTRFDLHINERPICVECNAEMEPPPIDESEAIRNAELLSINPETADKIDRDRKM